MDFPDDDDDELFLSNAVDSYETQANKLDESVRFVGTQDHDIFQNNQEDHPEEKYLLALKDNFGHNQFRPLQWKIIKSILVDKRDCCAIMTTGYGKSLCYQFPSVYTSGVTLVISPLISLMEDQVMSLSVLNIKACLLGSAQKEKLYEDIVLGLFRVVYLTPEFITGDIGMSILRRLGDQLTLVAIDEAHCVSSWGHDFRSAFRALSCIRGAVPDVPIMALTATATKSVLDDIVQVLRLKNPQKLCSGFDRPNLKLMVRTKVSPWTDLQRVIRAQCQTGSAIIYCLKRADTEDLVKILRGQGIECAAYHAGLSLKTRKSVHESFSKDQLRVIVATCAFGMGIDKKDVRCVINYGASREIESYYQEIGRAGRDGEPAHVITFYNRKDFEFHAHMRQLTKSNVHKDHLHALNLKFQEYLESTGCRRKFIMQYFGDPCADKLTIKPNCCDNCDLLLANPGQPRIEYEELDADGMCDFRADTKILLTAIDAVGSFYGLGISLLLLQGSNNKKLPPKLEYHPIRGKGANKPDPWWKQLYDLLERKGYVVTTTYRPPGAAAFIKRTKITVTMEGTRWLHGSGSWTPLLMKPTREMFPYFNKKRKADDPRILSLDDARKVPVNRLKMTGDMPVNQLESLQAGRDKTYEEEFLKRLIQFRMSLASGLEVMPYMIVSEKCLQQMVDKPPTGLEQLSNYEGLSLAKISLFGGKLIAFVRETIADMKKEYPEHQPRHERQRAVVTEAGPSSYGKPPATKENVPPVAPTTTLLNASLLDDDDEEIYLLEQAVLNGEAVSPAEPHAKKQLLDIPFMGGRSTIQYEAISPRAEPTQAKKKLPTIPSAAPAMKYDDSDSDGDDIIASIPSTQQRVGPGWLSARTSSQSRSPQKKSPTKKARSIKSVW